MKTLQIEEVQDSEIPTTPRTAFAGGFYYGRINIDGQTFALVLAPRAHGEFRSTWGDYSKKVKDAYSVADGLKNTLAMAEAGLAIAAQAQALVINDKSDWYIPARDELEQAYRHLKPTDEENECWWRDGENLNAVPPTAAYTKDFPAQTQVTAFQPYGAEALRDGWYWTSTQVSAGRAAIQSFSNGIQLSSGKGDELRVRVVRRLKIL